MSSQSHKKLQQLMQASQQRPAYEQELDAFEGPRSMPSDVHQHSSGLDSYDIEQLLQIDQQYHQHSLQPSRPHPTQPPAAKSSFQFFKGTSPQGQAQSDALKFPSMNQIVHYQSQTPKILKHSQGTSLKIPTESQLIKMTQQGETSNSKPKEKGQDKILLKLHQIFDKYQYSLLIKERRIQIFQKIEHKFKLGIDFIKKCYKKFYKARLASNTNYHKLELQETNTHRRVNHVKLEEGQPQLPQQIIKKKKGKGVVSSRIEAGIYRKTGMFDEAIKKCLKKEPFQCVKELRVDIKKKEEIELAKETLIRRIKHAGYKYEKYTIKKPIRNTNEEKELRDMFVDVVSEMKSRREDIYFFGECQFTPFEFKGKMWMKFTDGEPFLDIKESEILTICMILSKKKIEYYQFFEGGYSREKFMTTLNHWFRKIEHENQKEKKVLNRFYLALESREEHIYKYEVDQVKEEEDNEEENIYFRDIDYFFMNESQHKEEEKPCKKIHEQTKMMLANFGIGTLYIPAYSCQLNPTTSIFNRIKFNVRQDKPQNTHHIKTAIEKAIKRTIDDQDIQFAFKNWEEQLKKAKKKENFNNQ